jgi:hypothetical protein
MQSFLVFLSCYLLTPWNRVLLEKLTGFAASQEIPCIYGTRKFITIPTSAHPLSYIPPLITSKFCAHGNQEKTSTKELGKYPAPMILTKLII